MFIEMIVQRFIDKLALPATSKAIIKSVTQLNKLKEQSYLELYHTIRSYSIIETKETVHSIVKNGFRSSIYGNKGFGVYLSSHSAYGCRWVGATAGMLICHLKIDEPNKIKRFLAEIPPGYEYVVDPDIIIPSYFVEYEIVGKSGNQGYRKLGQTGCKECDNEYRRCDCPIEPAIYPVDNIVHLTN